MWIKGQVLLASDAFFGGYFFVGRDCPVPCRMAVSPVTTTTTPPHPTPCAVVTTENVSKHG